MSVADSVGRDLLANTLGLSDSQANGYAAMEQALLTAQASLQTMQQNLGPAHPEVVAMDGKIRATEQFLRASRNRVAEGIASPARKPAWTMAGAIAQQKLAELRKKERFCKLASSRRERKPSTSADKWRRSNCWNAT